MPSFNRITIVGHCGIDPEQRFTPQGTVVSSFTVATTEKRKDREDVTTWFRVTAFGKLAELAQQYLSKGKLVYVDGRLRLDEYTDKEGNRRSSLEVTAGEIQFIGAREDSAKAASVGADEAPF